MANSDTFQAHFTSIMRVVVEAAVSEIGRLLDESSAAVLPMEISPCGANSALKRKLQKENKTRTREFAYFMEVLGRAAVEKMVMLVGMGTVPWQTEERNAESRTLGELCTGAAEASFGAEGRRSEAEGNENADGKSDTAEPDAGETLYAAADNDDGMLRPFACEICAKSFGDRTALRKHASTHEKPHRCPHCGKSFAWRNRLELHLRVHSGEKPFLCEACGKKFRYVINLEKHLRTHARQGRFSCARCQKAFPTERLLDRHNCSVVAIHSCPVCFKVFRRRAAMLDHLTLHSTEQPFCCETCGLLFSCQRYLHTHQKTHLQRRQKTHLQTTAKRSMTINQKEKEVNQGQEVNQEKEVNRTNPYAKMTCMCDVCGKRLKDLASLTQHARIHTGERPYACDTCGKTFNVVANLRRHQVSHTGQKRYACLVCGKRFTANHSLKEHMLGRHSQAKPFSCGICGRSFSSPACLRQHRRSHPYSRPHACTVCGKSFLTPSTLTQHARLHVGERRQPPPRMHHACSVCGRTFTLKNSLTVHMRVHTGERPYVCERCGKRFTQASHLATHRHVHTGLKPHRCGTCGRGFVCRRNLRLHKCKLATDSSL